MQRLGWWLEVTTLVIPGLNDSDAELTALAGFIAAELGENTPWHVSRFHPCYHMTDRGPTPTATLTRAWEIGRAAGLKHVYVGNLPGAGHEDTLCPACSRTVISRRGAFWWRMCSSTTGPAPSAATRWLGDLQTDGQNRQARNVSGVQGQGRTAALPPGLRAPEGSSTGSITRALPPDLREPEGSPLPCSTGSITRALPTGLWAPEGRLRVHGLHRDRAPAVAVGPVGAGRQGRWHREPGSVPGGPHPPGTQEGNVLGKAERRPYACLNSAIGKARRHAMTKAVYEKKERIAYVTLNRPEALNALDDELNDELWDIWSDFNADPALDVAILTGAGKAFCAGADLKTFIPKWEHATMLDARRNAARGIGGGITRGQHRITKPIIAAINGHALGGGFELALACDIRIASQQTKFGVFEVRQGLHQGDGGLVRLVAIAGVAVALELSLTGREVAADEALRLGLGQQGGCARRGVAHCRGLRPHDCWATASRPSARPRRPSRR